MRTRWLLVTVLSALLVAPVLALPNPGPPGAEELEANRRVVGKWRTDPEHYARLKNDLRLFKALSPDRQERMRALDARLFQLDAATRAELWGVMDRYVTWLERLAPADRQKVEDAATSAERLEVIRQLREKEWLDREPAARRREILAVREDERPALVAKYREEERERSRRWEQLAANGLEQKKPQRDGQPLRLNEFPTEIQSYVQFVLTPALSDEEKRQLEAAQDRPWPEYARELLALSEQHPPVLPGQLSRPLQSRDIPTPLQKRLREVAPLLSAEERDKLKAAQGKWPEYGMAISAVLRKRHTLMWELWPTTPGDRRWFGAVLLPFVETKLLPVLTDNERAQLRDAQGKWPEYSQAVLDLATAHKLQPPGMRLPEPRGWSWDRARKGD